MADRMIHATKMKDRRNWRNMGGKNYNLGVFISLIIICAAWFFGAHLVDSPFTFPYFEDVIYELEDEGIELAGSVHDFICPENCTIIGRKGSINNPMFVEEKFWNVDTAFGLCPSDAIFPKFLFYFCEYFDFTTLDSSTTLPSLTKTNIQQIIFALPPIEEQKRVLDKIEELFGKLDEIDLNLI